jgi:hypothetical protein
VSKVLRCDVQNKSPSRTSPGVEGVTTAALSNESVIFAEVRGEREPEARSVGPLSFHKLSSGSLPDVA